MLKLKIIRTVFQDFDPEDRFGQSGRKFILVIDMETQAELSTTDIPNLPAKMETALPGVFPGSDSPLAHTCGGRGTEVEEHAFREEIARGTSIPHLLEHVLLHLLSRRSNSCAAYCGQRSIDLQRGITTQYYIVLDYPSKVEAVIAADLAFNLISAWVEGRTVTIDPAAILEGVQDILRPMVHRAA